jgi:DNA polymerase III subunit delta'
VRIDTLSHAILFSGEEGSGALPQALSLAKYILCTQRRDDGKACGTCPSCRKTQNGIHPDLHFVVPVNRGKGVSASRMPVTDDFIDLWRQAFQDNPGITEQEWYEKLDIENKQGAIGTAEAENMIRKLQFRSFEGGARVMIIWLPERMNISASNKLLKILEEPSPGTYFLLVSHRPDQLLPTIRSRCMHVQVPPKERRPVSAQSYALLQNLLDLCFSGKPSGILEWAEDMASRGRESQKAFLSDSLQILRQYYMVFLGVPQLAFLDKPAETSAARYATRMGGVFFQKIYLRLNTSLEQLERNVNARPLFCSLAFDFFLSLQR